MKCGSAAIWRRSRPVPALDGNVVGAPGVRAAVDQKGGQGDCAGEEDQLDDDGEERVEATGLRGPFHRHVDGVVVDGLQGERRVAVVEREDEGRNPGVPAQHSHHEVEHARRVLTIDDHHHLCDERHEELGDAEEEQEEEVRDEGEELDQQDGERGPPARAALRVVGPDVDRVVGEGHDPPWSESEYPSLGRATPWRESSAGLAAGRAQARKRGGP